MKKRIFALAAFAALGAAHAQAPVGDAVKGRAVFARCATCHLASGPVMIGPSLVGVVGRKAGTVPGVMYSPALKSSGIVWDDAKLAYDSALKIQMLKPRVCYSGHGQPFDAKELESFIKRKRPIRA